jgi:hypothetical protein
MAPERNKEEPGKVISTIATQADSKHLANLNDETAVHCRQLKPQKNIQASVGWTAALQAESAGMLETRLVNFRRL